MVKFQVMEISPENIEVLENCPRMMANMAKFNE
jgi:hypothetical protein